MNVAQYLTLYNAALGRFHDCFVPVNGDSNRTSLASRQLSSLQRRFATQQVLETPKTHASDQNVIDTAKDSTNNEIVEKEDEIDGFCIRSQPTYERGASQRVLENLEDLKTPCRQGNEDLERDLSENNLQVLESRFIAEVAPEIEASEVGSHHNLNVRIPSQQDDDGNDRLTPAVHSADRVQLNDSGLNYFPIFRSKKDCKIVYLIRHGESEFNAACCARGSAWEDPLLFDARLTLKGKRQALCLREEIKKWDLPGDALWITSPLTRAIETLLHVHPDVEPSNLSCRSEILQNVLVLPEVAERLHTSGDIGRRPSDLMKEFPMLGTQLRTLPNVWWFNRSDRPNCPYQKTFKSHETRESINKRIKKFRKWIIDRPEKAFVAVGHSMFWKDFATTCHNGIKQETMRNCEWKVIHV